MRHSQTRRRVRSGPDAGREWLGRYSTSALLRDVYQEGDPSADDLNRMLYLDVRTLLPGEILYFNDMLSMAHSLEVRAPFLDWRLVELAASIPGSLKIRGRTLKYILGKVAARYVPAAILDRPKEGFVLPANTWLRAALAPLVETCWRTGGLRRTACTIQRMFAHSVRALPPETTH